MTGEGRVEAVAEQLRDVLDAAGRGRVDWAARLLVAAVDAHDQAHGVVRVSRDDMVTAIRAARALQRDWGIDGDIALAAAVHAHLTGGTP